jgi:hypothetical protein
MKPETEYFFWIFIKIIVIGGLFMGLGYLTTKE